MLRRRAKWILFFYITICNVILLYLEFPEGPACWSQEEMWTESFKYIEYFKQSPRNRRHFADSSNFNNLSLTIEDFKLSVRNSDQQNQSYCSKGITNSSNIIILVKSTLENIRSRNAIRMTWGHYQLHTKFSVVFVALSNNSSHTSKTRQLIKDEIDLYGDLIIFSFPFTETKVVENLFIFSWLELNCLEAKLAFILEDHFYLNIPAVINMIYSSKKKSFSSFYGTIETKLGNSTGINNQMWTSSAFFLSRNLVHRILNNAWKLKLGEPVAHFFDEIFSLDPLVHKICVQQMIYQEGMLSNYNYCQLDEAFCIPLNEIEWPIEQYLLWHYMAIESITCFNTSVNHNKVVTKYNC